MREHVYGAVAWQCITISTPWNRGSWKTQEKMEISRRAGVLNQKVFKT
jgi:hypothetical protein